MSDIESKLSELQLAVYDLIRSAGWEGRTVDEIEVALGKAHQSVSARVNELENWTPKPLIERRASKRPTRSGRKAWIFVMAGLKRTNKEDAGT
jgi:predicted transcriptional regulator